jgi:hypothetical protein
MALQRYTLTATVTVPAGAFTASSNGFGTGSYAQGAGEYGSAPGTTWIKGTVIYADPAGALFTAIGAGNLAAYRDGTDAVGHAAVSN